MRAAATVETGHHQAAIHRSETEFLDMVLPFVQAGISAGEPIIVADDRPRIELLSNALGPAAAQVEFHEREGGYVRPSSTIRNYQERLRAPLPTGVDRVRVVEGLPHGATDAMWCWWARYECAVNEIFTYDPVTMLCPYDARWVDEETLKDVRRTHPYLTTIDGEGIPSPTFVEPTRFRPPPPAPDPLQATTPLTDLVDPHPAAARSAAREAGRISGCDPDRAIALELGADEAVTNAMRHGVAPVRLRLWSTPGRVVAAITDAGPGPADPLAGLVPSTRSVSGGLGLWLIHQTCDYVTFNTDDQGFTITLTIGDVVPAKAAPLSRRN